MSRWKTVGEMCPHMAEMGKHGMVHFSQAVTASGEFITIPVLEARPRKKNSPFAEVAFCPMCGEKNFVPESEETSESA